MVDRTAVHVVSRLRDERGLGTLAREAVDLIERLITERDEARNELLRMDEKIAKGQESLIAERDEARTALKPFAELAKWHEWGAVHISIQLDDLRKACAVFAKDPSDG